MTGIVNHCNSHTRESWGAFLIVNEQDSPTNFSIVNQIPYIKVSESLLNIRFVEERYPHQFEF